MKLPDRRLAHVDDSLRPVLLLVAAANEVVWRTQPDTIWALWRFPGLQLVALAFTLTQLPLMMHGMKQVPPDEPG
jgi:intracellular septation protein